jgi:hypothetical protein
MCGIELCRAVDNCVHSCYYRTQQQQWLHWLQRYSLKRLSLFSCHSGHIYAQGCARRPCEAKQKHHQIQRKSAKETLRTRCDATEKEQ